jgi:outer membrane lipoprotein-sorting protein
MSGRRQVIKAAWATTLAMALCTAFMPMPAAAQTTPDLLLEVSKRLDNPAVLRGDFEQTKTLKGFKRPLVSRGTFVMARGRGVQWVTTQPFASTLVVTRERLLTLTDGGVSQQIDTRQEPGLRAVNEMLMALLAGDVKALSARFKAEGALQGEHGWHVVLSPRDAALAGFITRIELDGDRHVKLVVLQEASGDDSRIRFTRHEVSTLTPLEIGRFGP